MLNCNTSWSIQEHDPSQIAIHHVARVCPMLGFGPCAPYVP